MMSLGLSYYILQKWLLSKEDPEVNERLIQCQAGLLDMMIRKYDLLCSEIKGPTLAAKESMDFMGKSDWLSG